MPNIVYNRPLNRKKYLSIEKHQVNSNSSYSKWLSINIERQVFDYADYGNFQRQEGGISWTCNSGNLWGLLSDRTTIGTEKQQFGFFQKPTNVNDEWHGFPIIPFSQDRYKISDTLLERWVKEGVISEDDVPSIMNKKRI